MSTHIVHLSQTSIARAERLQKEADEIISASATIEGRRYHSDTLSSGEGFDVVIDGEVYPLPSIPTAVCVEISFPSSGKPSGKPTTSISVLAAAALGCPQRILKAS